MSERPLPPNVRNLHPLNHESSAEPETEPKAFNQDQEEFLMHALELTDDQLALLTPEHTEAIIALISELVTQDHRGRLTKATINRLRTFFGYASVEDYRSPSRGNLPLDNPEKERVEIVHRLSLIEVSDEVRLRRAKLLDEFFYQFEMKREEEKDPAIAGLRLMFHELIPDDPELLEAFSEHFLNWRYVPAPEQQKVLRNTLNIFRKFTASRLPRPVTHARQYHVGLDTRLFTILTGNPVNGEAPMSRAQFVEVRYRRAGIAYDPRVDNVRLLRVFEYLKNSV